MDNRVFLGGLPFMISCVFQSLVEPGFADMGFITTLDNSVRSPGKVVGATSARPMFERMGQYLPMSS